MIILRFSDKLNTLLQVYRISSIDLARGMGVDPSLVSRWRSGERSPSKKSKLPDEIGAFLAGVTMLPLDRELLSQTIGRKLNTYEDTSESISTWLRSDGIRKVGSYTQAAPKADSPSTELGGLEAADVVRTMSKLLMTPTPSDTGPVNLWTRVQKGQPAEHELFQGAKGRRQAAINFLHSSQAMPANIEMYIMPGDSYDWITEDSEFSVLWQNSLVSLMQRGHPINILLPAKGVSEVLLKWSTLPLYHSGACNIYVYDNIQMNMLLVANGYAAATTFKSGESISTHLYRGMLDTSAFTNIFKHMVQNSTHVLYSMSNIQTYAQKLMELEGIKGAYYTTKNMLSAILLPEPDVAEVLTLQGIQDTSNRTSLIRWRNEHFKEHVQKNTWVEILPKGLLDEIRKTRSCSLSALDLLTKSDVTLTGKALARLLEQITATLERYPNYHIVWMDVPQVPVQLTLKSGYGSFFSPSKLSHGDKRTGLPMAAFLGEQSSISRLEDWFKSFSYDRNGVIRDFKDARSALQ